MGQFDTLAVLVTDLANATISVISVIFTGDNAGVVLSAVVVLALVTIFAGIPEKIMSKYFRK